jgi:chemotaxis response regulator CheB
MHSSGKSFLVVGIGGSAGGLEAISELLTELPAKTGIAFLFVQHLSPRHQSFLADILSRKATIAVETAAGRIKIESKEQARARRVPSPDRAEALMLALGQLPWKFAARH